MILNRLFLSEEYKQYLTFSVEISTNTLITQYSKHLWSDEQEHTHNHIKSLHDSGKGYRTIAKLLNAYLFKLSLLYDSYTGKTKALETYTARCIWRWRCCYINSKRNA